MPYIIVIGVLIVGLCLPGRSHGQTDPNSQRERQDSGGIGTLSPELISKIRELAILVQKKLADEQLNDVTLQREVQEGDVGAAIRGFGPDGNRLLDEIKASLQSNYSEESLAVLLQVLTNSSPTSC